MLVDLYVHKLLPGADPEFQRRVKDWLQICRRLKITCRVFTPETGSQMDRVFVAVEFPSYADREKFWSNMPEDMKAWVAKMADIYDLSALEHHYFREVTG